MKDNPKVAILGLGFVGEAFTKLFPDAVVYDEPKKIIDSGYKPEIWDILEARRIVNECDLAIVCVPTPMGEDGTCDLSIIKEVVSWLETDLICIKSTIEPGTVDYLREKYNKRVTYSVEIIGEGKYFIPPWKYPHATDPTQHDYLVVGGDPKDTSAVANIFWSRLSPDLNIYQMSGTEAELTKYMLNTWGAMKVTFANEFYEICKAHDVDYMKVLQAWGADGRVEKMHMRVVEGKQGFGGKCFPKDVNAIYQASKKKGYEANLIKEVLESNERFLANNE